VCWLYGRQIHQALGGRPIGLIATSYGGTAIEYWMPPKALQDCNTTTLVLNIIRFFLFIFFRFCMEVEMWQYNHMMNLLLSQHSLIRFYLIL
jgi:hypothetical protein